MEIMMLVLIVCVGVSSLGMLVALKDISENQRETNDILYDIQRELKRSGVQERNTK